jgi:CDP-glucose 4,6-dehydratase
MAFGDFFRNKKVLVTGDTGFKGSWLCFWLKQLGAEVYGVALEPNTDPSNFRILQLNTDIEHHTMDIRNPDAVNQIVEQIKPEVVFHLAAQALVRLSYEVPLETLETNFMGTAYLLDAVGKVGYSAHNPCTVVVITSDKCYENRETYYAYREEDPMGGHDIYSMSKGVAELLVASWRRSFFNPSSWPDHGVSLASVRAGNVIGGGDWAQDRIVVDSIKALVRSEPIEVRNPRSVRPWQHVLEPLSGYLQLAAEMSEAQGQRPKLMSAYNFGPGRDSECTVKELVELAVKHWGRGSWKHTAQDDAVHEATYLKLSTDKAWHRLRWRPTWGFETCVKHTVEWYKQAYDSDFDTRKMRDLTTEQIAKYTADAAEHGLRWARQQ